MGVINAPYVRSIERPWDARNYGWQPGQPLTDVFFAAAIPKTWAVPSVGMIEFVGRSDIPLTTPLATLNIPGTTWWKHGLAFEGSRIVPTYNDNTKPVIKIASAFISRGLVIDDIEIYGEGRAANRQGHGLELECTLAGGRSIYNFRINRPHIEAVGGSCLRILGNVFEGSINFPTLRGSRLAPLELGHHASGGILSSVDVYGAVVADGGEVNADNADGAFLSSNALDIWFHGIHAIGNGRHGIGATNGLRYATGHFENNHRLATTETLASQNSGINTNKGAFVACYFLNSVGVGKQTHGYRVFPANRISIVNGMVSGQFAGPTNCEIAVVTGAMSAGTQLALREVDGNRSSTMRTNVGSGIVVDDGEVYPYVPSAPGAGGTTTIPNNPIGRTTLLRPAGTIATHTVTLPTGRHGNRHRINTTAQITALTYSPAVTGWTNGSQMNANTSHELMFENATWYLI